MRAGWTASGALTNGSTVLPRGATRRASGGAVTTSTTRAEPNRYREASLAIPAAASVEPIADRDLSPDDHVPGLRCEGLEVGGLEMRLERRLVVIDLVEEDAVAARMGSADIKAPASRLAPRRGGVLQHQRQEGRHHSRRNVELDGDDITLHGALLASSQRSR